MRLRSLDLLDRMEGTGQDSDGKEVSGEFVVAHGDAEPTAQVVFNFALPSIETLGTVGRLGGVAASDNDG